jgi:aryl-alcohol dehydrogenase-like predicted oxidoreductase
MLSDDGLDFLRRNPDISGWVYTATLQGSYDRTDRPLGEEYQHAGNHRRRSALTAIARERELRPGQVIIAWLASGQPQLIPIVGVSTVEQVEQTWSGVTTKLTEDDMATLDAV